MSNSMKCMICQTTFAGVLSYQTHLCEFYGGRGLRTGVKADVGKEDYSLLTMRKALDSVVRVLEYGAKKYSRENWRRVPEGKTRYLAAAMRHLLAHASGEINDSESGEPHLAHAACSILFALELSDAP